MNTKTLTIRPYARLLTMLGEQLIKNERIALIELIKNAYDADAEWVKITFLDFEQNYAITDKSKIIIEDNGVGMTLDVVEKHWLNPATPEKLKRKQSSRTTPKGRIIQGEKGIGRFAIFKLGRNIEIVTRHKGDNFESVIHYDFSKYDDEFLTENGQEKEIYIDDLNIELNTRQPEFIKEKNILLGTGRRQRSPNGTRIVISNLKGTWTEKKLEDVYNDLSRLESIFIKPKSEESGDEEIVFEEKKTINNPFEIFVYKDDQRQPYNTKYINTLHSLLEHQSVIKVENGVFDNDKQEFRFLLNRSPLAINLRDSELTGMKVFRDRFGLGGSELDHRSIECGSFEFEFYLFDFSSQAPPKYALDKEDKKIIKAHRIYLYRDGIRVYPYGEPDDDWLRIDIDRGTISAALFLSNDQVVGHVNISQELNPLLKDKTNREGLIEEGNATADFIALVRIILAYLRGKHYKKYRIGLKNVKAQDVFKNEQVKQTFIELKETLKDDPKANELVRMAEQKYLTERNFLVQRAEATEELAGVGLSVETASHDIMAIMGRAMNSIDSLIMDTLLNNTIDKEELNKEMQALRGMLSFIEAQLKDIQLLFKSSKQRRRNIKIITIVEKVEKIYRNLMKKVGVKFEINEIGPPLVAKTTDAVLLQLLLNLIDNSIYWLQQTAIKERSIIITLDGSKCEMIFSDNGPGIDIEDRDYIFEPFYSGKGEEGRGLGLYIARQLLERNDYSIALADIRRDKILPGANFIVSFVSEEN